MTFNQVNIPVNIILENDGTLINNCIHLKYPGSRMASSQKDFEIRKALYYSEIHKMESIWNFKMENSLKIINLKTTIEPILL